MGYAAESQALFAANAHFSYEKITSCLQDAIQGGERMQLKKSEEILAEVHRNCALALQSIGNILPEAEDAAVKEELLA